MIATIVLFGASRRVGKDTAADMLMTELRAADADRRLGRYSFAQALRSEVADSLRIVRGRVDNALDVWTEDPTIKESVVRPLLIAWGRARRHQKSNYWAECVAEQILSDRPKVAVISDWRYPNEAEVLGQVPRYRTIKIHVSRPGISPAGDEAVNDPLCREMADFQWENNGTLDNLKETVHNFIQSNLTHETD